VVNRRLRHSSLRVNPYFLQVTLKHQLRHPSVLHTWQTEKPKLANSIFNSTSKIVQKIVSRSYIFSDSYPPDRRSQTTVGETLYTRHNSVQQLNNKTLYRGSRSDRPRFRPNLDLPPRLSIPSELWSREISRSTVSSRWTDGRTDTTYRICLSGGSKHLSVTKWPLTK